MAHKNSKDPPGAHSPCDTCNVPDQCAHQDECLNTMFRRLMRSIFRYALSRLADSDLAEDVVGETLLRFFNGVFQDKYDGQDPTPSIMTIAVNVTHEVGRDRKRRVSLDEIDEEDPEHSSLFVDRSADMEDPLYNAEFDRICAIAGLNETEKLALSLSRHKGLSVEAIAGIMKTPAHRVRRIIKLARTKLQRATGGEDWESD